MSKTDDGGPAFPVPAVVDHDTGEIAIDAVRGMSLRDWFAGQALAGILAGKASDENMWNDERAEITAKQAYERADAMLAARRAVGE